MKYMSPSTQNKVKLSFKLFAYFLVGYARSFKHKLLTIHDITLNILTVCNSGMSGNCVTTALTLVAVGFSACL